ncbi:hypothetical protein M413DRAFT_440169 [Hebeloma cylindrosporum]|uniref:Uncharacterized protein n=1 Tax=Hebeloma cylindrosporum TaxID=76867 RepID=A0A0C2Z5F1_HEBCY|nr:hypothetical protein M413DRAFT_440169 [Hebeloma cylindrosporum h7]
MLLFRRKETPWEVVDSRSVDPVPMYYEDEDLDLVSVKDTNVRRTYVLELKRDARQQNDLRNAVVFAREQLLKEITKSGYNALLLESWRVTLLRKAKLHRVEVEYSGRPALAQNKAKRRHPPFMAVLQTCH